MKKGGPELICLGRPFPFQRDRDYDVVSYFTVQP